MTPLRVAFAPSRAGGLSYLDDLADALPADRVTETRLSWEELAGSGPRPPVDVVHLHWVQMLIEEQRLGFAPRGAAMYLRRLARLRSRGIRLVWTMHNLASHEGPARLDRLLRRATAAASSRVVLHCEAGLPALRRLWPPAQPVVVAFPAHRLEPLDRGEARRLLGLEPDAERVVAIPGAIRAYKDVPGVLRALVAAADPGLRVMVAGKPRDTALEAEVRQAAGGDRRVLLRLTHQSDDDLRAVIAAADVVLLPYRRVLTSGAVVTTLSEGTPVVAPSLGCLPEQAGPGALLHPAGDPVAAVRLALETPLPELRRRGEAGRAHVLSTTWAATGERMAAIYEQAAGRRP